MGTYTYVELPLTPRAYAEVAGKLHAAGYQHAFGKEGTIDMHGLALVRDDTPAPAGQLPLYQSHKQVRAARILGIDGSLLTLESVGEVDVGAGWVQHRGAVIGGYYVQYEDGYSSFSPARAFEKGHTKVSA